MDRFRIIAVGAAGCATVLVLSSAIGSPLSLLHPAPQAEEINLADLDTATPAGAHALRYRLVAAAEDVCDTWHDAAKSLRDQACILRAITGANTALKREQVADPAMPTGFPYVIVSNS